MKKIIRQILLFIFALIIHQFFWQNLELNQAVVIIEVAVILSLFELIIKPIVKILLLPINILTLGLFRLVINTLGLYLAVFLVGDFSVKNIDQAASVFYGIPIPAINFSGFFAYLATSISLNFMLYIFNQLLIRKIKK